MPKGIPDPTKKVMKCFGTGYLGEREYKQRRSGPASQAVLWRDLDDHESGEWNFCKPFSRNTFS